MNITELRVGDIYTLPNYVNHFQPLVKPNWAKARHKVLTINTLKGTIQYVLLDDVSNVTVKGEKGVDVFCDLLRWGIKVERVNRTSYLPDWL